MEQKTEDKYTEFISTNLTYAIQAIEAQISKETIDQFGKLVSNEDRFTLLWNLDCVHQVLQPEGEYRGKSVIEADKHRNAGSKYFQKKMYVASVDEYTKSVLNAPMGEGAGDALSLAYANRSAALFHLKIYKLVLRDTEHALDNGYPDELKYKVYYRRGQCYMELKQRGKALSSFARAGESLEVSKLDGKSLETWKQNIYRQINQCDGIKEGDVPTPCDKIVEKRQAPNLDNGDVFPDASAVVDIKWNKEVGRHMEATDDISIGDVVICEKPYVSVLFQEAFPTHCYNCMARPMAPLPCPDCSYVAYCSKECQQQSWHMYHQYECRHMELFDKSWCGRAGHLALRIPMATDIQVMLQYLNDVKSGTVENATKNKAEAGFNKEGVYAGDYHSLYNMDTAIKVRMKDSLMDLTIFAIFLVKVLQITGTIHSQKTKMPESSENEMVINFDGDILSNDEIMMIGGAMLHHLMQIQCNVYVINELQNPHCFDDLKLEDIGNALYPTTILINHSCAPTADFSFYGDTIVVRAMNTLHPGDEIMNSYGPEFHSMKQNKRRINLNAQYSFDCKCKACIKQWPHFQDIKSVLPNFRCEHCRSELFMVGMVEKKLERCKKCNNKSDVTDIITQLKASHDVFAKALEECIHGNTEVGLPVLVKHMVLMENYLCHPWRDLVSCQAAIRNCYHMRANVKEFI